MKLLISLLFFTLSTSPLWAVSNTILEITGLNTGVASTASASVKSVDTKIFTIFIKEASGNIAGVNLMLQCSYDNINWFNTAEVSGGLGDSDNISFSSVAVAADYVRIFVKTASSVASTSDIVVQAK